MEKQIIIEENHSISFTPEKSQSQILSEILALRKPFNEELAGYIIEAIEKLTTVQNRCPTKLEVIQDIMKSKKFEVQEKHRDHRQIDITCNKLFIQGRIFTTKDAYSLSLQETEEHLSIRQWIAKLYPGFSMAENLDLIPIEDQAPVIANWKLMKGVFLSSEKILLEQNRRFFEGKPKLLDSQSDMRQEKIALATFKRTGSSFLRKLLEKITGVSTGSDSSKEIGMQLWMSGFMAEELIDDQVWIVKTHFPVPQAKRGPFETGKVIIVNRNPLDAIISGINLFTLLNHEKEIEQPIHLDFKEYFEQASVDIAQELRSFYEFYKKEQEKVPVFYLRYEDLQNNPKATLEQLFSFIFNLETIEGLNIQRRIDDVISEGLATSQVYKLKSSKLNRHQEKFSLELMDKIKDILKDYNYYFGYAKTIQSDNHYGVFGYDNEVEQANESNYEQFKKHNQEIIQKLAQDREQFKPYLIGSIEDYILPMKTAPIELELLLNAKIKE